MRRGRKARDLARRDRPAAEGAAIRHARIRCGAGRARSIVAVPGDALAQTRLRGHRARRRRARPRPLREGAESDFDRFTLLAAKRAARGCASTTGACAPTRPTSTRGWTGTRTPGTTRTPTRSTPASALASAAPGVDPARPVGQQALHPVRLLERHLPAVRRPTSATRRSAPHWIADARSTLAPGLPRPLRRRREHGAEGRRRQRPPASAPVDPRTGETMSDADVAALHGRLHGARSAPRSRTRRSSTTPSGSPATETTEPPRAS